MVAVGWAGRVRRWGVPVCGRRVVSHHLVQVDDVGDLGGRHGRYQGVREVAVGC